MAFLRRHWFDVGLAFGLMILIGLCLAGIPVSSFRFLLWVNAATLFFHQFEEYRFPGYFPGMLNVVMYRSPRPDRYPLNANTSLGINILLGWTVYVLAAALGKSAVWLTIAAVLVSAGNFVAHTFLFNLKGKTLYNPGAATAVLFFLPVTVWFFCFIIKHQLATPADYFIGFALGLLLNFVGVLKVIDWCKDADTPYLFEERQLLPKDRRPAKATTDR